MPTVPAPDLDTDERLVRALLRVQAPHLADRPLSFAAHGWDNDVWRLGEDLAVRIPRRGDAAHLLDHEQAWLPRLAPALPLPVPAPVVVGRPQPPHVPWSWSVVPWFPGRLAADEPLVADAAPALGRFLRALHVEAPHDAPRNPYRGVPLAHRRDALAARLEEDLPHRVLAEGAAEVFASGAAAGEAAERVWLHGDLHPGNVLVRGGRVSAVLDWGDVTAGDPACDLSAAWWFFDVEEQPAFWAAYGDVDEDTWRRARGWAALFGVFFLNLARADDPTRRDDRATELARRQLERVVSHQEPPVRA